MKKIQLISIAKLLILSLFPISLFAQPIIWEKIIEDNNEVNLDKKIKWEPINELSKEICIEGLDQIQVPISCVDQRFLNDSSLHLFSILLFHVKTSDLA